MGQLGVGAHEAHGRHISIGHPCQAQHAQQRPCSTSMDESESTAEDQHVTAVQVSNLRVGPSAGALGIQAHCCQHGIQAFHLCAGSSSYNTDCQIALNHLTCLWMLLSLSMLWLALHIKAIAMSILVQDTATNADEGQGLGHQTGEVWSWPEATKQC